MAKRTPKRHWWILTALSCGLAWPAACLQGQIFTVGQKTATASVDDSFDVTHVELPNGRLSELGRRELERMLVAEQGFAHRALPLGGGLTLAANGPTTPDGEHYRKLLYEKGQAAAVGDRVAITAVSIKGDRMVVDFNGGPYAKHRFLSHVQINGGALARTPEEATGARVTLVFPGGIPEITAPEVKALLQPVVDFGVKTSEEAYADTLPQQLRDSIAAHEVLVGMNRRMVLAALGQPANKVRERAAADEPSYEEWIYGQTPETVRFIRFHGDRVSQIKIAEYGKPVLVRTQNEMNGYEPAAPTREVLLGDRPQLDDGKTPAKGAPTLQRPGEAAPPNASGKVQMPTAVSGSATPTAPDASSSPH